MNWFKRKPPIAPQIRILDRDPSRLDLTEWRADKDCRAAAQKELANPHLQHMLDVLRNQVHRKLVRVHPAMTAEQRSAALSFADGYSMAVQDLESMAVKPTETEQPLTESFEKETLIEE